MNKDMEVQIKSKLEDIHLDVKELRVDVKDHIGRITKAEADISWIKGHMRIITTLAVTIVGALITYYFSTIK